MTQKIKQFINYLIHFYKNLNRTEKNAVVHYLFLNFLCSKKFGFLQYIQHIQVGPERHKNLKSNKKISWFSQTELSHHVYCF
jgi:hypothetical protein